MDFLTNRAEKLASRVPYMKPDEILFLRQLVFNLPHNAVVVNIGAGIGVSALAIMETRKDISLCTVDIQREVSPTGCLATELHVLSRYGYAPSARYRQIHGSSQEVAWDGGPIGLIFVDDGHGPEQIAGDIVAWKPRMKPGGVMVFHDYDRSKEAVWPAVAEVVDEMMLGCERLGRVGNTIAFRV